MATVLTISQLNTYISSKLKFDVKLKGITLRGEISNLSVNFKSGHIYYTLRDEASVLKAVMFSSNASRLRFELQNGMKVIAMGNIEVYERDGVYQLVTTDIIPDGVGQRSVALDQLKKKLSQMGVFNPDDKRKIPQNPKHIAVVTSPHGAALQDILNIIERRYPICKVTVVPTLVQGENAPSQIEKALCKASKLDTDIVILARGGGSDEDLSAFNTEKVALAVYNCSNPIISAVGHETDTTLADLASDLRAPTPSAAAELAVPNKTVIISELDALENTLKALTLNCISSKLVLTERLSVKLKSLSPHSSVESNRLRLEALERELKKAISAQLERLENTADHSIAVLNSLSPLAVLSRGYSVTFKNDKIVRSPSEISSGDELKILLENGEITAVAN